MKLGVVALIVVALMVPALDSSADEVYPLVFPVVGENRFTDTYDACRGTNCSRRHLATDIISDKMTPVVAAADGIVRRLRATPYTDGCGGGTTPSYSLYLEHDDGYESRYLHLNNDTPGTDDGQGQAFAPGLVEGSWVAAGQLIGWVGDSGNAECVGPHLHFELYDAAGTRFNPYESLLAARHINPAAADEIFFYRADGLFRYYDINADGSLGAPMAQGDHYTRDWSTITAIDLDGDGTDEMFFYRVDGLFRFYDIRSDGTIPAPLSAGDGYTKNWTAITAVDLDGDGTDEMFFYREDGLFRYYDVRSNGTIGKPISSGDGYTNGWDAITAVDIDGDGADEMFFYREDGLYRFYDVRPNGTIGSPIRSGSDYPTGWTSITAIDLNGDGKDEMLFYRSDGTFSFQTVSSQGVLGSPLRAGSDFTSGWSSITSVNLGG